MKKAILVIVLVLASSIAPFFLSQPAYAACPSGFHEDPTTGECVDDASGSGANEGRGGAATKGTCEATKVEFLSFPTWYRGLACDADGKINIGQDTELSKTIFTIALNVLDILLRLVGILAVGFVIYGGIRYITSNGEPEKAKQALDTILKAAIGMVIAMIAAVAVSFIVSGQGMGRLSHYIPEGAWLPSQCPYAHGRPLVDPATARRVTEGRGVKQRLSRGGWDVRPC